jgi:hypothetical protein
MKISTQTWQSFIVAMGSVIMLAVIVYFFQSSTINRCRDEFSAKEAVQIKKTTLEKIPKRKLAQLTVFGTSMNSYFSDTFDERDLEELENQIKEIRIQIKEAQ